MEAMFTGEQMTGSGQTSMIDLINENESRKSKLRVTHTTYFSDPGHGWLRVQFNDLKVLGILGAITPYSYRDGDTVYLEEDKDANTFVVALFGSWNSPEYFHWKDNFLTEKYSKGESFVRNLPQFHI